MDLTPCVATSPHFAGSGMPDSRGIVASGKPWGWKEMKEMTALMGC